MRKHNISPDNVGCFAMPYFSRPGPFLILLAVVCCSNLAVEAASRNEEVSQYIDDVTTEVSLQEANLTSDIEDLNVLNQLVGAAVASIDTGNPESIAKALNTAAYFQQGLASTQAAAQKLGKSLELAGNVFDAVKRKEADGTLPAGTLTPIHLGVFKDAQTSLSRAQTFIGRLGEEVPKQMEKMATAGVKPTSVDPTRAGLVVISSFFPEGRTTAGPRQGYVWIVNFSRDKSHTFTVRWDFNRESGSVEPAFDQGTLAPGESRKIGFTVNVRAGGELRYKPDFQWR